MHGRGLRRGRVGRRGGVRGLLGPKRRRLGGLVISSRRRRGREVDIPWRRVAARLRPRRGTAQVGDEVWTLARGAYADYVRSPEAATAKKPTTVDHLHAGTMPEATLTSILSLKRTVYSDPSQPLPAGSPWGTRDDVAVVVTAGSGGTGSAAIQLAKAWGAKRIITSAHGDAAQQYVRDLGATDVSDYEDVDIFSTLDDDSVDYVYRAVSNLCSRAVAAAADDPRGSHGGEVIRLWITFELRTVTTITAPRAPRISRWRRFARAAHTFCSRTANASCQRRKGLRASRTRRRPARAAASILSGPRGVAPRTGSLLSPRPEPPRLGAAEAPPRRRRDLSLERSVAATRTSTIRGRRGAAASSRSSVLSQVTQLNYDTTPDFDAHARPRRNQQFAVAASTEYRGRGAAATRLRGIPPRKNASTSQVREDVPRGDRGPRRLRRDRADRRPDLFASGHRARVQLFGRERRGRDVGHAPREDLRPRRKRADVCVSNNMLGAYFFAGWIFRARVAATPRSHMETERELAVSPKLRSGTGAPSSDRSRPRRGYSIDTSRADSAAGTALREVSKRARRDSDGPPTSLWHLRFLLFSLLYPRQAT